MWHCAATAFATLAYSYPGLSVHMNQVHKENLTHVENANPGRQGLEIEIFGMEGVPAEIIDQHNQQVTQAHFAEEAERARITGNPIRGQYTNGVAPPNKRAKVVESLEEIEQRADQYRTDRKNGVLPLPKPIAEIVSDPVRRATDRIWRLKLTRRLDSPSYCTAPLRRSPGRLPHTLLPTPIFTHKRRHATTTRQLTWRSTTAARLWCAATRRLPERRPRRDTIVH
jgi:hypothetical protein